MTQRFDATAAHQLWQHIQIRFNQLYVGRARFSQRALGRHLEENILPDLALYQMLRERGQNQQEALPLVIRLFQAAMRSNRKPLEFIGRFPLFFTPIQKLTPRMMEHTFPAEGWQTEWVEINAQVVAFNLHTCSYLNTLTAYQDVSPHISWDRSQTLARGAPCCDFRFSRTYPS